MHLSNRKGPHASRVASVEDFRVHRTIELLDELLTHTLPLRDLYIRNSWPSLMCSPIRFAR